MVKISTNLPVASGWQWTVLVSPLFHLGCFSAHILTSSSQSRIMTSSPFPPGCSCAVSDRPGMIHNILSYYGMFRNILSVFGMFRNILLYFGMFQNILSVFGMFQNILLVFGYFRNILSISFWDVLEYSILYFRMSQQNIVYFGLFQILTYPISYILHPVCQEFETWEIRLGLTDHT